MASFDGTVSDPTLRHALGVPSVGFDELADFDPDADIDLIEPPGHAKARELQDFNADNRLVPPGLPFPLEQSREEMVEVQQGSDLPALFLLRLIASPDAPARFELRRLTPAPAPAPSLPAQSSDDPLGELAILVDASDWPGVVLFLEHQLLLHRTLLHRLRVVANAHRDGIQNAVDTVQTKRLDFEAEPEETTIAGAVMALVLELTLIAIPAAIGGRVLIRLATGLFALTGVARAGARKVPAFLRLREHRRLLAALRQEVHRRRPSSALGASKGKKARMTTRIVTAQKAILDEEEVLRAEAEVVKQVILEARHKATQVVTNLQTQPGLVKPAEELVKKAARGVTAKVTAPSKALPSPEPALPAGLPHVPVDVAVKMQVQDFFENWLTAAEEGCLLLEELILSARSVESFPDEASTVLERVLLTEARFSELMELWGEDLEDIGALRARLETEYELLVWALKYYDVFQHPTKSVQVPVDPVGMPHLTRDVERVPPEVDKRLLRYLVLRFFPALARKEGEMTDPKALEDPRLLTVFKTMRDLASAITASIEGRSLDEGEADQALLDIFREIEIVRRTI